MDMDIDEDVWVTPRSANDIAMRFNLNDEDVDQIDNSECTFDDGVESDKESENGTDDFEEEVGDISNKKGKTGLKRPKTSEPNPEIAVKKPHTRKRWDAKEEACISAAFKEQIDAKLNPSGCEIKLAQEKYPYLRERSIPTIKAKVNNIILGKCKMGNK